LRERREAILEELAVSARGRTKSARRNTGGAMERADKVGQIGKSDVERNIGDRAIVIG
jgi:hypothetical protein